MDKINEILNQRRKTGNESEVESKFFSIPAVGHTPENFLELRFREGLCLCFSYHELSWFNYNPDAGWIDMEFGGFLVSVKGRGLYPVLFNGIKAKQVAWVKEADSPMQDNKANESYVEEIKVIPPKGFNDEEEENEQAEKAA